MWTLRKLIVHFGGVLQMAQAAFLNVLFCCGVTARGFLRNQRLRLRWRHAQINHAIFTRQTVDAVFKMLEPGDEFFALRGVHASRLMRKIRRDVAVREHQLAFRERVGKFVFRLKAIAGIQKGCKMRIDVLERAKFAIQKLADHRAEP